jgi:carbon monoxide dehydrogenase subunit G
MKIEGTQEVRAGRERVFQALLDPEVLGRCIPGVEKLEQTGDHAYALTLRAGVGSIKGLFTGNVRLQDLEPPTHYRMVIDGKGQPGFLKGTGDLDLDDKDGVTIVKYAGDAQIGGTIAGVGQRMIQAAAKMMVAQFFAAIEVEAQRDLTEEPPKHGFVRTALRATSKSVRRALQGTKDEESADSQESE